MPSETSLTWEMPNSPTFILILGAVLTFQYGRWRYSVIKGSSADKLKEGNVHILLIIGIILLVLWLLGAFAFSLGGLVHIALVIAVIFVIVWVLKAVLKVF
jgi:hypothetical protein